MLTTPATPHQNSTPSLQSLPSTPSIAHRRGRRRYLTSTSPSSSSLATTDPSRIYHCTWRPCSTPAFARKGDWKRHESTAHLPQCEWVCMLTGPVLPSAGTATAEPLCAFCETHRASVTHLEAAHRVSACAARPDCDRAFVRKDKLAQHLALAHAAPQVTPFMAAEWVRRVNRDVAFECGFCGARFVGWRERCDHVAGHFEEGMVVEMWRDGVGEEVVGVEGWGEEDAFLMP